MKCNSFQVYEKQYSLPKDKKVSDTQYIPSGIASKYLMVCIKMLKTHCLSSNLASVIHMCTSPASAFS